MSASREVIPRLINRTFETPSVPLVLTRIIQVLDDDNASSHELEQLILQHVRDGCEAHRLMMRHPTAHRLAAAVWMGVIFTASSLPGWRRKSVIEPCSDPKAGRPTWTTSVRRSMKKRGNCGLKHARYEISCRL